MDFAVRVKRWARLGFYLALGVGSAIVAACGDDDESGPAPTGDAGATDGTAGAGGSAGTGGTAGAGGTAGVGGATAGAGGSAAGAGGTAGAGGATDGGKLWDVICE